MQTNGIPEQGVHFIFLPSQIKHKCKHKHEHSIVFSESKVEKDDVNADNFVMSTVIVLAERKAVG